MNTLPHGIIAIHIGDKELKGKDLEKMSKALKPILDATDDLLTEALARTDEAMFLYRFRFLNEIP
jgi:hypothetical protein